MRSRPSIALGFLALILVGAIVLSSPWARVAGTWGDPMTALFTACSAVCVTGLTVAEIGVEFTRLGQVVVLTLVEVGCLGLMTCGTFLLIAIVIAFVLAMFLTPPDPMSQIFMAIPLCLLYEVSIWAVWLKEKGMFALGSK